MQRPIQAPKIAQATRFFYWQSHVSWRTPNQAKRTATSKSHSSIYRVSLRHHLLSVHALHTHIDKSKKMAKTYNSGYSPVVTHLTTNPPVSCLSTAERTGSSIFKILWSYVKELPSAWDIMAQTKGARRKLGRGWMRSKLQANTRAFTSHCPSYS